MGFGKIDGVHRRPSTFSVGIQANRSTDDNIFVMRRVMEEYWNAGEKLFILSIDVEKAFDFVDTNVLGEIFEGNGIPKKNYKQSVTVY